MILFILDKNTDSDLVIRAAIEKYITFSKNAYIDGGEIEKMLNHLQITEKTLVSKMKIVRGGKPYLEYEGEKLPIKFSLSDTSGLTIVGVALSEVGVDCETIKERDFKGIAKRENFDEVASIEDFYDQWTRREAVAKYYGKGFSKVKEKEQNIKATNLKILYNCSVAVATTENILIALLT